MKHARRRLRVVSTIGLLVTLAGAPPDASAQAPVHGVHTTMGPGAGLTASVSASGDYATAVPLDLPSPRGAVPVPISVVHTGGRRAGVAGLGWDVPLSYVRVSRGAWQRKPAADGTPDERVVLVLDGASALMVPHGDHYVPFAAGEYQELRRTDDGWTLTTLANLEYTFRPAATVAAGDGMPDPDLWLLTRIRDRAGSDEVVLEYAVDGVGDCGPRAPARRGPLQLRRLLPQARALRGAARPRALVATG